MQPSYAPFVFFACAASRVATVSFRIRTFFFETSWPLEASSFRISLPRCFPRTSEALISFEKHSGIPSWSGRIVAAYEKQKPILSLLSIRRSVSSAMMEKNSFALTSRSIPGMRLFLKSLITGFRLWSKVTRHVLKLVPPASMTITCSPSLGTASGEQKLGIMASELGFPARPDFISFRKRSQRESMLISSALSLCLLRNSSTCLFIFRLRGLHPELAVLISQAVDQIYSV